MSAMAQPRFTTQELFAAVAADPRVKAYPRLVAALRDIMRSHSLGHEANARALLKELREIGEDV